MNKEIEFYVLEEFNRLQEYMLKNSVDKKYFWEEWSKVYSKVKLMQIALKSILLDGSKLSPLDRKILERKLAVFMELERYLREMKEVAIQVKGYSFFSTEEEFREDNDEWDEI